MQKLKTIGLAVLLGLVGGVSLPGQGIPVRFSFKFILDSTGNRPATGDINTDAEVLIQVNSANQMFASLISELRLENVEIANVAGASAWYSAEPTGPNSDNLRAAAMADPSRYLWRNDAVNVYITSAPGAEASGIADFAPNNNIILLPQGLWENTLAHEAGHILGLYHTQETCCGGDGCDDTLADNAAWTQDDIAMNNFGRLFMALTANEQNRVNLVWWNVMSYHNGDQAFLLTPCQMDRQSLRAFADRTRFLSKSPVYVDAGYGGSQNGSFSQPYHTIQEAVSAGNLAGHVMVLKQGVHTHPAATMAVPMEAVTRAGISTVNCQPVNYSLPSSLEKSANSAVRDAIRQARESDRRKDPLAAMGSLRQAEELATGREKTALQIELAQRLRDNGQHDEAAALYSKVAEAADQPELKKQAVRKADALNRAARLLRESKAKTKE